MYGKWLISADYESRLRMLVDSGRWPTVEQQRAHREEAAAKRAAAGAPPNYRVEGSTAIIGVTGLLTPEPDFICEWFGLDNTTYADISASVARAESDPAVKNIRYEVNSGGGMVDGITDAVYAIDSARKPSSVVSDYAASAAYWIATRAAVGGKIQATSPMASFGSIGVAVDVWSSPYITQVASTDAPDKRPDVKTEEGYAAIQKELDAIHDHFAGDVADARGVSRDKVNSDFGRGGMLLADAALAAGMIDDVVSRPAPQRRGKVDSGPLPKASDVEVLPGVVIGTLGKDEKLILDGNTVAKQPQPGAPKQELKSMDLATLKASHPDVYKAAREEGIQAGVRQERDRTEAHLNLAEGSGDTQLALKHIKDGTDLTLAVQSAHMAAAMKRGAKGARQEDDKVVADATKDVPTTPVAKTEEELTLERENRIGELLNKHAAD